MARLSSSRAQRIFAIAGVLALAALLRLQDLDQPYVDKYAWREADTASIADAYARGAWNIFLPQVRWGGRGPNYIGAEFQTVTYLAALGYRLVGTAAWVGRAVLVAFGVWGIFALYQLVRRIWDEAHAVAAAAVMAVLPGSVFIERSFLPDGAMTALMTTSLWMLVRYCQTERQRYLVAASFAGALGCLTKLPGGILVIPAIYVVASMLGPRLRERRIRARLVAAALAVAAPAAAYYLWAWHIASSYPPYHFTGHGKFLWNGSVGAWLADRWYVRELWWIGSGDLWGLPFMTLALAGALLPQRAERGRHGRWFFHAWLAAVVFRYAIEARHLVADPYNFHVFNPMIAAFAARALVVLAQGGTAFRSSATRGLLAVAAFTGAAVHGQLQARDLYAAAYQDHYVLGRRLAELSGEDDLVISMGNEPLLLYHSRRNGWVFPPYELCAGDAEHCTRAWDYGRKDVALLRELKSRGARWLVIPAWNDYTSTSGLDQLSRTYPELHAGIADAFAVVRDIPEGVILRAK